MNIKKIKIVLDTNVLFSGLYSRRGNSFRLLQALNDNKLIPVLSIALLFEYEEILKRNQKILSFTDNEIETILDVICLKSQHQKIYFLWRPSLPDPKDDHLLELAVASGTKLIVTFNLKDFKGIEKFDVKAITPKDFLEKFL